MPQPAVCCGARNETGEFDLEERMESGDLKLTYLLLCSTLFSGRLGFWVSGKCFLEFGWDNVMSSGKNVGGEDLCDPLETTAAREAVVGGLLQSWA